MADEEVVVERNEPIHTDGRVTEDSIQKRLEDKLFPPKKADKPEAPAPDAAPPQDTQEGAQSTETEDESEVELEWNGAQYKVPKDWKPVFDGYKDYTQKTMVAADRQRHADLIIEQARQSQAMQSAVQPKYEAVNELNRTIKQYEAVDWNTWIQSDPVAAQKGMLQLQVLNQQKAKAEGELQQTVSQQMELINQTRAKLKEENEKALSRKIKGWTADSAKKLDSFAGKTYGFSDQELSSVYDSRVREMMHDAMRWHELQASKPQMQKVVAQAKTMKPEAADSRNAKQVQQSSLKREIKSAKAPHDKAKAIQKLLESRLN